MCCYAKGDFIFLTSSLRGCLSSRVLTGAAVSFILGESVVIMWSVVGAFV